MRWNPFSSNAEAGPSSAAATASSSSKSSPETRWKTTLEDEERYQALQYPQYKDVPTCMSLLDDMFSCSAAIPQMRHYYRYGTFADCSGKWRDFKYCLSLKSETEEERRQLWIKRRAEWWAGRRVGRSSEDIWEAREKPPADFPSLVPESEAGQLQESTIG